MPTLFPIRPLTPEPELHAANLPDPVGPLAAPSHLKLERSRDRPTSVMGDRHGAGRVEGHQRRARGHPH